ncbi:TPA: hypothetical protein ACXI3L_003449 [Serratia marcescens]
MNVKLTEIKNNVTAWLKIPADGSPLTFTGNADEAAKEFFNALIRVRDGYISALKAERDALAVENAALKDVLENICCRDNEPEYHDCGMGCGLEDRGITDRYAAMAHGWESAMERVYEEVIPFIEDLPETPATDAALAAIQAQGVERLADKLDAEIEQIMSGAFFYDEISSREAISKMVREFATELREAK